MGNCTKDRTELSENQKKPNIQPNPNHNDPTKSYRVSDIL